MPERFNLNLITIKPTYHRFHTITANALICFTFFIVVAHIATSCDPDAA